MNLRKSLNNRIGRALLVTIMMISLFVSSVSVFAASVDSGQGGTGSITINKLLSNTPSTTNVTGNGTTYTVDPTTGAVTLGSAFNASAYKAIPGISFDIYEATLVVGTNTVSNPPAGGTLINGVPPTTGGPYYFAAQTYLAAAQNAANGTYTPEYYLIGNKIGTGSTDANGQLTFSNLIVGSEGNEVAYYIVENNTESTNQSVTKMADPFIVQLPMDTDLNPATPQENNVQVYPKNAVQNPRKTTGTIDPTTPNVIPYQIQSDIPATILNPNTSGTPTEILVTDPLDPRLTLVPGSVTVTLVNINDLTGATPPVDVSQYFTVNYPVTVPASSTVSASTNALTLDCVGAGMAGFTSNPTIIADLNVPGSNWTVQVDFKASILPTTDASTLTNQATLYYNDPTITINNPSDVKNATVNLVSLDIRKIDPMQNPIIGLNGATFALYVNSADAQAAADYYSGVSTTLPPAGLLDGNGNPITTTTATVAGEVGDGAFSTPVALIADTYYLVETQAPTNYNMLGSPVTLTITGDATNGFSYYASLENEKLIGDVSNQQAITLTPAGSTTVLIPDGSGATETIQKYTSSVNVNDIPNRLEVQLPLAGGTGHLALMIGIGFVLVAGALTFVLVLNKRKTVVVK